MQIQLRQLHRPSVRAKAIGMDAIVVIAEGGCTARRPALLWARTIVDEGPIRRRDGISLRLVEGMGLGTDRFVQVGQQSRVKSDGEYGRDRDHVSL